jgi:hypothetical protein
LANILPETDFCNPFFHTNKTPKYRVSQNIEGENVGRRRHEMLFGADSSSEYSINDTTSSEDDFEEMDSMRAVIIDSQKYGTQLRTMGVRGRKRAEALWQKLRTGVKLQALTIQKRKQLQQEEDEAMAELEKRRLEQYEAHVKKYGSSKKFIFLDGDEEYYKKESIVKRRGLKNNARIRAALGEFWSRVCKMNDGSDLSAGRDDNAVHAIFCEHDLNGTGNMDAQELGLLAYKLGEPLNETERHNVEKSLLVEDMDGKKRLGLFDYDEFLRWWLQQDRLRLVSLNDEEVRWRRKIADRFLRHDPNLIGSIDRQSFVRLCRQAYIEDNASCDQSGTDKATGPDPVQLARELNPDGLGSRVHLKDYMRWHRRTHGHEFLSRREIGKEQYTQLMMRLSQAMHVEQADYLISCLTFGLVHDPFSSPENIWSSRNELCENLTHLKNPSSFHLTKHFLFIFPEYYSSRQKHHY